MKIEHESEMNEPLTEWMQFKTKHPKEKQSQKLKLIITIEGVCWETTIFKWS